MPFGLSFTSRPLSPAEVVTDLLQPHGESLLAAAAITKSTTALTEELLTRVLKTLLHAQPALRMKVFTELSVLDRVPMKTLVEMRTIERKVNMSEGSDRKAWLDIVHEELARPLQASSGPLWKLCYMECPKSATLKRMSKNKAIGTGLSSITEDSGGISAAARPMHIGSSLALQAPKSKRYQDLDETKKPLATSNIPLHEGVIILKVHQVIADELSLFDMFHSQFIPILNALIRGHDSKQLFKVPLKLSPSVEESCNPLKQLPWHKRRSLRKSSSKRLKLLHSQDPETQRRCWLQKGFSELADRPPVACVLPFAVMENVSRILCMRCHANQVHMSSVMLVASAISLGIQARRDHITTIPEELYMNLAVDFRAQSKLHLSGPQSLGMWKGIAQVKLAPSRAFPSAAQFWRDVKSVEAGAKHAEEQAWELFRLQKEALKQLPKYRDISKLAGLAQGHMEVSVLDNVKSHPSTESHNQTCLPDDVVQETTFMSSTNIKAMNNNEDQQPNEEIFLPKEISQSRGFKNFLKKNSELLRKSSGKRPDVKTDEHVSLEEFYFMRSMSELSDVPLSLGVCVYKDRLMCTVTYNMHWVKRTFATNFVDIFLRVLHDAVSEEEC